MRNKARRTDAMNDTLKKIWNVASTVIVILVVLCAVFLMGSRLVGFQCYTVLTGSMEPVYSPGDLIYVKHVYGKDIAGISDPAELERAKKDKINTVQNLIDEGKIKVGDPITFMLNETTVATHRIVEIDEENHKFRTKGDANETTETVLFLNLVGKVYFSIPALGIVSNYIQNPPGMYIAIAAGIVLIILVFLPDMLGKKKKGEDDPEIVAVQSKLSNAAEENEKLKAEVERLRAEMNEQKDKNDKKSE